MSDNDARKRFDFHMTLWGYSVEGGHDVRSRVAEDDEFVHYPDWDNPTVLDTTLLNGERPPDWMACYWLGEHKRRGHG